MIQTELKKKMNPMLVKVIVISVLVHVVGAFIAGVVTIATIVIQDDAQFEEPPSVVEEEPPREVKVVIRPEQAKVPQTQRLKMRPVANIAVANVDVNLPTMDRNFTVSAGLGGVGGGRLLGGTRGSIGMGLSDISVFGLKTRAERILFVIDTNRRMVTDEKGGLDSYRVIKDEISDMVGNLSAGTLFNVMLTDIRRIKLFKPRLVPSGNEVHQELIKWISTVNNDAGRPGLEGVSGSIMPLLRALPESEMQSAVSWNNGHNHTAFMTQLVIEQSADAIFMITGDHRGFGQVVAPASEAQLIAWEEFRSSPAYKEKEAAFYQEEPQMKQRVANELAKINKARASRGEPPRVLAHSSNDVRGTANELGLNWRNPHPGGGPGHTSTSPRDVEKHFTDVIEKLYTSKGQRPPSLNVILFLAGDEVYQKSWEDELKSYVRFFEGRSRIIRGKNEIKSARSATETVN
jgi:hypothetical protein